MNKWATFFRKILKIVLWITISLMLLFIIIALLIQIPAIQNKIVQYATSYVSKKTNTKVEIKRISISFPKSVVIEGLFLEDTKKDTLLYAGQAKASIIFRDLFKKNIHITAFALDNVTINLYRPETDSLFNFNFLISAFSDTIKPPIAEPDNKNAWSFGIDEVCLKNIRIHFNDNYEGINVNANLKQLDLTMHKTDIENSIYSIDELVVESLTANVLMKKSLAKKEDEPTGVLPVLAANKIQINNTFISYGDSISKMAILTGIRSFKIEGASLDVQKEIILLDNLYLSQSSIQFSSSDTILPPDTTAINITTEENNWKVSAKVIELHDNSISYTLINKPVVNNSFDPSHINFKQLSLNATDFYYDLSKTKVSVKSFSAVDNNKFSINSLETDFSMDAHTITANNLKIKTSNSSIDADVHLKFSSLNTLADSIPFLFVNADLRSVSMANTDILYFSPELYKQIFFKNKTNKTTLSGNVSGTVNNLKGKNVIIKTGTNTNLKTDFEIVGLPSVETTVFNFPNLKIFSVRQDLKMMLGPAIPQNIELPQEIALHIYFNGHIKSFITSVGFGSSFGSANLSASIDNNQNFKSRINITHFDLSLLLKDTTGMFGTVSLTAQANGQGLEMETIKADINIDAHKLYLNKYTYQNLNVVGALDGRQFEGKIKLNDKNAVVDIDGLVNLNPNQERLTFKLNLQGADLKKLNLTKDNMQIALIASANLNVDTANGIGGFASITNLVVAQNEKIYPVDSLLMILINEPDKSKDNANNALIGIKFNGAFHPSSITQELTHFVNTYFIFSDTVELTAQKPLQNFNFEIRLLNNPILREVFFPELNEFEPGVFQGSFDAQKKMLKLNAGIKRIVYGSTVINNLLIDVNTDSLNINYKIFSTEISNAQIKLDNFLFYGIIAQNRIMANMSSTDDMQLKKLFISAQIVKDKTTKNFRLSLLDFYLMNGQWDVASENYIEFGHKGLLIHHLFLNKAESKIRITSVNDKFNDDLKIEISNLNVGDISKIIEKDSSLVKGMVDGNVLLKRIGKDYGIVADARITDVFFQNVPIGTVSLNAENPIADKYVIDIKLSGADNNATATGYFMPAAGDNALHIEAIIQSISMKTIEAFSMKNISNASGNLKGKLLIKGKTSAPDITGTLVFNEVLLTPAALNNQLYIKNETIVLKNDGIYFNAFTISDEEQHAAIINGNVQMNQFTDFTFDLNLKTDNFLLFNTSVEDNPVFFGRMIIDSKIDVTGPMSLPVINAKIKLKNGSSFTFAVPEDNLTLDKGDKVVVFEKSKNLNPIIYRGEEVKEQKSAITGYDISSIIEIDKQATLRLLIDPASSDSLVVRGEAALSFAIDRSGKMSLTGAYNLNEGSYIVSIESLVKRKFDIEKGSTITWNGDPLDAEISINAIYSVRASPIDLVADQMSGLNESDKNEYKQRYPFLVYLKLRKEILNPEISFEIKLAPEDIGILGGAVNAKLNLLNEDPSALNKQVFALLVLGRFVQENPLQSESGIGVSSAVRTTVGKFLSEQLNQLSSKMVPGVELNFDIQSADDYQTGGAQGSTQVDIGVKKQLFNERFTVQIGGTVDVEGEKAKQNSASDITSDVTVEYKLTEDGRYRLKGFRHNQYEGALEGQLIETGAGILFVRDFNKWKNLFKKPK